MSAVRCRTCGYPQDNHPFRHPFIALTSDTRIMPHWYCETHGAFDAKREVGCPECVADMRGQLADAKHRIADLESLLAARNQANAASFTASDAYQKRCEQGDALLREARDYVYDYGSEATMAPIVARIDAHLAGEDMAAAAGCQHDLLLQNTTCVVGSDPFSATCSVCKTTYTTRVVP